MWARKNIKQTNQKQNDTHNNPVEEGLVFKPEQYVYSSSIDYAGGKGLLDIFYWIIAFQATHGWISARAGSETIPVAFTYESLIRFYTEHKYLLTENTLTIAS